MHISVTTFSIKPTIYSLLADCRVQSQLPSAKDALATVTGMTKPKCLTHTFVDQVSIHVIHTSAGMSVREGKTIGRRRLIQPMGRVFCSYGCIHGLP